MTKILNIRLFKWMGFEMTFWYQGCCGIDISISMPGNSHLGYVIVHMTCKLRGKEPPIWDIMFYTWFARLGPTNSHMGNTLLHMICKVMANKLPSGADHCTHCLQAYGSGTSHLVHTIVRTVQLWNIRIHLWVLHCL